MKDQTTRMIFSCPNCGERMIATLDFRDASVTVIPDRIPLINLEQIIPDE